MKNASVDKNEKYLPLGTVVTIKENLAMYMISGYVNEDEKGKMNDYIGVPYPYGMVSFNALYFFDHKDIETVVFTGMFDDKYEFLNKILKSKK